MREFRFRYDDVSWYDRVSLPGGTIDTRLPVPIDPSRSPRANYPAGTFGLYVISLVGPSLTEWNQTMQTLGVIEPYYPISGTARFIGATPETAVRLHEIDWVQWIEPYHPFLKAQPRADGRLELSLAVEFSRIPGSDSARERVRAKALPGTDVSATYGQGGYIAATFAVGDIASILAEGTVVGVFERTGGQVSAPPPSTPADIPTTDPIALFLLASALALVAYLTLSRT